MPRRMPLLWALLGSVALHLVLLADPPESWLEVARQVVAQREGASSGELPVATQLLDMQEGEAVAALSVKVQPSAGLQVDWYRPPLPEPEPVSAASDSSIRSTSSASSAADVTTPSASSPLPDTHDKAGTEALAGDSEPASSLPQVADVSPSLVPEPSALREAQAGVMAEAMQAPAVVESAAPLRADNQRALAQAGSQSGDQAGDPAGVDGQLRESMRVAQTQERTDEWQMPVQGRLHFSVSRGEGGFVVGRAQHRWQHDGQRYTLESVTETIGLAALIHPSRVVWRSRGHVSSQGLRPEHFVVEKNGREMDIADLDWTQMQLRLSGRNQRELPLQPMTQDLLSMFYQLAHQLPEILRNREVLPVTNGRKLERYQFQLLGQEALQLKPVGKVMTVHVRVQAVEQLIDIWLAPTLAGLPVRIRYADGKGESFDQLLDELDVATLSGVRPR